MSADPRYDYYDADSDRWLDPIEPEPRLPHDLQLSINRVLMDRLDALEKKVKELQHCQSA